MSGFKTTSIFGSIINLTICKTILRKASMDPDFIAVLGDDIDLGFDTVIKPSIIYDLYDMINFPIAKDKTKFT